MNKSESIDELAGALAKAQGSSDKETEGRLINQWVRQTRTYGKNGKTRGVTIQSRFFEKIAFGASDCWYWTGALHKLGYGLLTAMGETKAHRVAWRLFNGDIPQGLDVLHKCDVRNCVNPEHLSLGTHSDNMRDMVAKGRANPPCLSGEANPVSKLTSAQVQEMRKERATNGTPFYKIAPQYGVTTMTAYRAITGRAWSVTNG